MKIQAVRGMRDLLPDLKEKYRYIEDVIRGVFSSYGYKEIGIPLIESTDLFQRLVGEDTDVVAKEMYTFEDRNGDSLTLRPEGTAGCVRAAQENGLIYNQTQRLWYGGPMFRHERPQKGRYRQFESMGAECFGMPGPDIDVELLLLTARIWELLGLGSRIHLEINSLGDAGCRNAYKLALIEYLSVHKDSLDADSLRRLETNPLRILDSKDSGTRKVLEQAPSLEDYLDDDSKDHFSEMCEMLDKAGLSYKVNSRIVRGLDYYNRTVFEWITKDLGSQGTVCGGGRYDGLVEMIGGKPTPGVGFGIGIDRLALMIQENQSQEKMTPVDVFITSFGDSARLEALLLAEELRRKAGKERKDERAWHVVVHCGEGKFKSQLKKADLSGAVVAIVIGEDELANGEVAVKRLRVGGEQVNIKREKIAHYLQSVIE